MINKNLCNPIPIHSDKKYWYCNKMNLSKFSNRHPCAPIGKILPMQLTLSKDSVIDSIAVSASRVLLDVPAICFNGSYVRGSNGVFVNNYETNSPYHMTAEYDTETNMYHCVFINDNIGDSSLYYAVCDMTKSVAGSIGTRTIIVTYNKVMYIVSVTGSFLSSVWPSASSTTKMYLYRIASDGTETLLGDITQYLTTTAEVVPKEYRTVKTYYSVFVPSVVVGITGVTFTDGKYYILITEQESGTENTYYSEPFNWMSAEMISKKFVHFTYRHNDNIAFSKNFLSFSASGVEKYMEMYLNGTILSPPFKFEEDVNEIDGFVFPKKRVSYVSNELSVYDTEYMARAVSLMWHCSDVSASDESDDYDIDYIEAPEVDWGESNVICKITVDFRTDTIIQTNGLSTSSSGSSDDTTGDFNNDFNSDFLS